ncbi:MAG: 50S ribosomal protein L23 [Sumerlaeia bacterium]
MTNKNPYDVLVRPIITERALRGQEDNKFTFKVAIDASKNDVRSAIEEAFGVKVVSVNTVKTKGKSRRTRYGIGKKPDVKKAVITLAEGQSLELA